MLAITLAFPYPVPVPRKEDEPLFQQLAFEGLAELEPEPIVVEHCIVIQAPTYHKNKQGTLWECVVYAPPDLFHQEQNDTYQLHATTYANEAKKKRLKPGDVVTVTGILSTQHIALQNGTTQEIKHLAVSDVLIVSRAPRKTVTIYEAQQNKQ
jgi:hypothetical protein